MSQGYPFDKAPTGRLNERKRPSRNPSPTLTPLRGQAKRPDRKNTPVGIKQGKGAQGRAQGVNSVNKRKKKPKPRARVLSRVKKGKNKGKLNSSDQSADGNSGQAKEPPVMIHQQTQTQGNDAFHAMFPPGFDPSKVDLAKCSFGNASSHDGKHFTFHELCVIQAKFAKASVHLATNKRLFGVQKGKGRFTRCLFFKALFAHHHHFNGDFALGPFRNRNMVKSIRKQAIQDADWPPELVVFDHFGARHFFLMFKPAVLNEAQPVPDIEMSEPGIPELTLDGSYFPIDTQPGTEAQVNQSREFDDDKVVASNDVSMGSVQSIKSLASDVQYYM